MINRIAFVLLSLILSSTLTYGKHQVCNPISIPSFDYKRVEKIIDDSYQIGVWGDGEVRKYKNEESELYLIVENDFYKNIFLVISKDKLPEFLALLSKGNDTYKEIMKEEDRTNIVKAIDSPLTKLEYEFIYLDKKNQDTYVYGTTIEDAYLILSSDQYRKMVLELKVGKAPKFPTYKDGKKTFFRVDLNGAISDLMNILSKSLNNDMAKVNPDSFERVGTYKLDNVIGLPEKRDILKYGEGINMKYYIEYGFEVKDETKYQKYLWIKGIKYKLFKQWIQDIFSKYYGISSTTPNEDNPAADIIVEYPKGMKLGGIIIGIFDVDMQVLEGMAINDEYVRAHISYDSYQKRYEVAIRIGEREYLFFNNVRDLKSFLDAL